MRKKLGKELAHVNSGYILLVQYGMVRYSTVSMPVIGTHTAIIS